MSALSPLEDMGVAIVLTEAGKLRLRGKISQLDKAQFDAAVQYAKNHKSAILEALAQSGEPGQCESCPAAGYWDHSLYAGQGLLCFHYAYYSRKTGRPIPCSVARKNCPRLSSERKERHGG